MGRSEMGRIAAAFGTLLFAAAVGVRAERFECLVEPYLEIKLSSAVDGILGEVTVDRGDEVKKGQVLARLVSEAEQAHLDLLKARAEFAARKVERNEELYLRQMISPHEKDELETEAHLLRLELREAEARLALRSIRSPIDGVVVERLSSPGEFVGDAPILRLAQTDPLRIETTIPVGLYGKLSVGMTSKVQWEAPGIGSRSATVTVVDPVVDAASGTIGVRLELRNPGNQLPAGVQCWVEFDVPSARRTGGSEGQSERDAREDEDLGP